MSSLNYRPALAEMRQFYFIIHDGHVKVTANWIVRK
jgi:hypothetical protein